MVTVHFLVILALIVCSLGAGFCWGRFTQALRDIYTPCNEKKPL